MIVAVNKVDLPAANVDKVKGELANQGLNPEDWGGDTVFANVSAKTKEGLDDLLENILLVAELEELKANPDAPASGVVIESHLDPGRGPVSTALIQRGTLSVGDAVVAGPVWGKVKAMHGPHRQRSCRRPSPAIPWRSSASTASARPASASRSSRTSAAPASSPRSAPPASRPRNLHGARRATSVSRTSSPRPRRARSRSSTCC